MSKMDVYTFGRKLLDTNDLDPVYVVLHHAGLSGNILKCWLVAYWCFYHCGTASWITDSTLNRGENYWLRMRAAAGSKEYPRSSERRHFRGDNATKSVAFLASRRVERLFTGLYTHTNAIEVMREVQTWTGFGPWISFKVADMLERLSLSKVNFTGTEMMLFDSPKQGAELLWKTERSPGGDIAEAPRYAVTRIMDELGTMKAPPCYERNINVQEVETILCKWKSYMGGHYELGEDILSLRKALATFGRKSDIAQQLYRGGKVGGLW